MNMKIKGDKCLCICLFIFFYLHQPARLHCDINYERHFIYNIFKCNTSCRSVMLGNKVIQVKLVKNFELNRQHAPTITVDYVIKTYLHFFVQIIYLFIY